MRTLALIGLVTSGLSGCVVYEKDRDHDDFEDGYDEGYDDLDGSEDGLEETEEDEPAAVSLAFYPSQAEQGEVFIGYLTVAEGEVDLEKIQDIHFYGDVDVVTFDIRPDEVIVTLDVDIDAVTGAIDLLVDMGGNDVIWMEEAFTIFEIDSGNSSGDDIPEDETSGTDDEDPTGGDVDGGDSSGDGADTGCD